MATIVVICYALHRLSLWDSRLIVASKSGVICILTDITRVHKQVPSMSTGCTASSGLRGKSILIRAVISTTIEDPTFVNYEWIIEYFSFLIAVVDLNVNLFIDTVFDLCHFLGSEKSTVILSILELLLGESLNKVSGKPRIPPHYILDGRFTDIFSKSTIICLNDIPGDQMTCLSLGILASYKHINNTVRRACWWMWSNRLIALMYVHAISFIVI